MKTAIITFVFAFLCVVTFAQNVGINESNPTNSLHIKPIVLGNHPLRIEGVQAYTIGDTSILVLNPATGVVKYMNASELSSSLLNTTVINNIADSLLSNTTFINNFGDSLFLSQNFMDSLTTAIYNNGDTLLYNTSFVSSLRDSIDTDVDSLTLVGTILTVYENGTNATVDLSSLSDNDADPTNELNATVTLTGNTLSIVDAGGTINVDLTPLVNNAIANAIPAGTVTAYAGSTAPTGYLIADGSAVSRTTYANLFAAIGTMYGAGDGSTTFNLPNYNGQFLRGWDNGQGTDPNATSRTDRGDGTTGDAVGTKQANQTLAHNHSVNPPATNTNSTGSHTHSVNPPATNTNTTGNHLHTVNPPATNTNTTGSHSHSVSGANPYNTNMWIPYDDNTNSSTVNETNTTPTTCGSSWNSQGTVGNFLGKLNSSCLNHSHTVSSAGNHSHSVDIPQFNSNTTGNHAHSVDIAPFNSASNGSHSHSVDISTFNSGNNGGAETRPTNVSVLWCIKF